MLQVSKKRSFDTMEANGTAHCSPLRIHFDQPVKRPRLDLPPPTPPPLQHQLIGEENNDISHIDLSTLRTVHHVQCCP